jgi:hypothetical protein
MANTITDVKRYVGRRFNEPAVQAELEAFANFSYVAMENDELGVEVRSGGHLRPKALR